MTLTDDERALAEKAIQLSPLANYFLIRHLDASERISTGGKRVVASFHNKQQAENFIHAIKEVKTDYFLTDAHLKTIR